MKKIILFLLTLSICLCSCNEQIYTRQCGGEMTINFPAGQELMSVTWEDNHLLYLTRPMASDYVPVTKVFQESFSGGEIRSTVYFKESR